MISGWRKDRQDTALSRKLPSMIANRLISCATGVPLHDYGCALKAYRTRTHQATSASTASCIASFRRWPPRPARRSRGAGAPPCAHARRVQVRHRPHLPRDARPVADQVPAALPAPAAARLRRRRPVDAAARPADPRLPRRDQAGWATTSAAGRCCCSASCWR